MNCNERLPYGALGFSSLETFVLQLAEDVLNIKCTQDGLKLFPVVPPQSVGGSRGRYPPPPPRGAFCAEGAAHCDTVLVIDCRVI